MYKAGTLGKAVCALLITLLGCQVAEASRQRGDTPPQVKRNDGPRRNEIDILVEQARVAPVEFGVDALIRVAESDKVTAKKKRALLEEAFVLASQARHPFRLGALPGSNVDTRSGYSSRAFDLELDALSLQCRAIRAMLALDKLRAREMFRSIPPLQFPPLACSDALVYNVSLFYETLGDIALNSFSAEERGRNEHVAFVESYLSAMTSPVQVGPAADVVLSFKSNATQFARLLHAFSDKLQRVAGDDRSFSYAVAKGAVAGGIAPLAEESKRQGLPREALLKAMREFLVSHLRASRCADNVNERRGFLSDPANSDYYNKTVAEIDPERKSLSPVSPEELRPSKVEGAAEIHNHWETANARKLLVGFKRLRFGSGEKALTVNFRRKNPDWESELNLFLNALTDWRSDDEDSEEDFYHQKSVLFEGLLELVPAGPKRDAVLESYVAFLRKPVIQQDKPLEWFLHVDGLLGWARSLPAEERARTLDLLGASGDPVLLLYARLEKLLPRKGSADAERSQPPPPSLNGNVTFRLKGFPYADAVVLAGNFNNWNQSQTQCAQMEGEWVCRIDLAPGKYFYKFIVDGEWILDPDNPLKEDDGKGNINSVLVVEDKAR